MSLIQHIKTFKFDEILEQIYKVFLELFSDLDILTILTVIATTTTASWCTWLTPVQFSISQK